MSRIITVTSGKGGVGKSSISVNLAIALAHQNLKVCLIDGDFGLKNLDVMMGLENRVVYDLNDWPGDCWDTLEKINIGVSKPITKTTVGSSHTLANTEMLLLDIRA